ncbi:OmpA family protein [Tellurirhabdus bombi]|uniref:OmpA family protein n=1 Tax=Tellurirhabdus bombi TaxID=2907205 RepID=UPI001F346F16|nr:OmpA family protein [Tellurirhabdus bombi]
MRALLLFWLFCLSAAPFTGLEAASLADTVSVRGGCWDVATGVDLKSRIVATVNSQTVVVGESNATGQFNVRIPAAATALTFEVAGYPSTTVPFHVHGKMGKNEPFEIGIRMIGPDSQQVSQLYQPTAGELKERTFTLQKPGNQSTFFQVRDGHSQRRLLAKVCFTPEKTDRTNCITVDSAKAPTAVGFNPGEVVAFDVSCPGYQTYRGHFTVGSSGTESRLLQIKLLKTINALALAYPPQALSGSAKKEIHYRIQSLTSQASFATFSFPISFHQEMSFKPGEQYQLKGTTPDGKVRMDETFRPASGLNLMAVQWRTPEPDALSAANVKQEFIKPKFFDSTVLYFDQSDYALRKEVKMTLDSISWLLASQRGLVAQVTGHTDNVGARNLNMILSEYRARVVAYYLQQKGIQPSQLSTTWEGPDTPTAPNDTEENRPKNRRVVVRILGK